MITILPFGGCTVNNPILNLQKRGIAKPVFRQIGFRRTPYALSPEAFMQLYRFCTGTLSIPPVLRKLMYVDAEHEPAGEQLSQVDSADLLLLEISTPYNLMLDGFALNHNRLSEVVLEALPDDQPALAKQVNRWKKALMAQNTDKQIAIGSQLLPLLRDDNEESEVVRKLLLHARCELSDRSAMATTLDTLLTTIARPTGLVLHNFCYMPDGRPVVWPADLNDTLTELATERAIPVYDPAVLITEHGTGVALAEDMRHWAPDFYPVIAEALHQFIREIAPCAYEEELRQVS